MIGRQCFAVAVACLFSHMTGAHSLICKAADPPIWESPSTFVGHGIDQFVDSTPTVTYKEPSGAIKVVYHEKDIARFRIGDGIYYSLESGATIRSIEGQPFIDALSLSMPWLPLPTLYPHVIIHTGTRNIFLFAHVYVTRATCY